MFDAAKQIVTAGLKEQQLHSSPKQLKEEIFLRFYGHEFTQADQEKIKAVL